MNGFLYRGFVVLALLGMATQSALAGFAVPGPIVGAGAPALLGIAAAYWLYRRMRQTGK